jgi:hypothetical protein
MGTSQDSIKRHNPKETAALWAWLESQPRKWWRQGTAFNSEFGWIHIFQADNWHCVYCGCDLARSEDALAESTEEHLVPQSVFNAGRIKGDVGDNVAACCATCNGLKSSAAPIIGAHAWKSRAAYIAAMSCYIDAERAKRAAQYRTHAFKVRAARVWSRSDSRQRDYL